MTKQDFELKIPTFHIWKIEDSYSKWIIIVLENMLSGWLVCKKKGKKSNTSNDNAIYSVWWNLFCRSNDVGSHPKPIPGIYNLDLFLYIFVLLQLFRSRTHSVCLVLCLFLCTANEHWCDVTKFSKHSQHWIEIPKSRSLNHWTSASYRIYNDEWTFRTLTQVIQYSSYINLFRSVSNIEIIQLRIPALC